jgi:HTH-type transcriptional regulator, transcriptional repressor of NAD biosynthesis genes
MNDRANLPKYRHALIVGKFAPLHRGHQFFIDTALHHAERLTILVYANPDFPAMPQSMRANWMRQLYPQAQILEPQDPPPDDAEDRTQREFVRCSLQAQGITVDVVFTSETYGVGFAQHLGVEHYLVDLARSQVPISGTQIRANIHAHQKWLDPIVYRSFLRWVVFLGAESTGKSTLAERMAAVCQTAFVPEYGRTFYEEHGGKLELADYVKIAQKHRELEDAAALQARQFLFVDTNAITTMFFSHYYDRASLPKLQELAAACRSRYDYVFVCDDDIPFEQDGWRDNVVWRGRMQGMILYDLAVRGIEYTVVSGSLDERVKQVKSILGLG